MDDSHLHTFTAGAMLYADPGSEWERWSVINALDPRPLPCQERYSPGPPAR
jgi:hypothetical protein